MPRFFKRCVSRCHLHGPRLKKPEEADKKFRLFKFPQMDFEMAIWEMTSLLIAPKKVFRSIYYHVRPLCTPFEQPALIVAPETYDHAKRCICPPSF